MPFIRLSDNYIDHPKFTALTDGAFRLWHEGMAFVRKHQTDGVIPFVALKGFRYFTRAREKQLAAPYLEGKNPLWALVPKTGYKVHDYLEWNPSKDEENERRADSRERMRHLRERRQSPGTPDGSREVRTVLARNSVLTGAVTSHEVLDRIGEGSEVLPGKGFGENPNPTARSKRPIFTGQKLTVFEWQFDNLCKMLGNYAETFNLHEWFFVVDFAALEANLVIPKRDGGAWLEAQLLAEVQRRGLPIHVAAAPQLGARRVAERVCPHTPRCDAPGGTACVNLTRIAEFKASEAV